MCEGVEIEGQTHRKEKEVTALVPMKGHSERVANRNPLDGEQLWHVLGHTTASKKGEVQE